MSRRKEPTIPSDLLDQLLAGTDAAAALDQGGLLDSLKKALAERALNAEMDHHLGGDAQAGNSRNGYGRKTVTTDTGKIEIDVPRDRQGNFDPQLIAKYQRRFPGFDDKIISMYARGMSTRDITGHLRDLYGVDVSPDLISTVTDAVLEEVAAWQQRPLDAAYPLVFFDANPFAADAGVTDQAQIFAAAIVIDRQNAELARSAEGVGHKVHRPAIAWAQRHRHWCAAAARPFAAPAAAHRQSFLAVQPVQHLVVHDHAFAFQHDAHAPVTEPAALGGDLAHLCAYLGMVLRAFTPDRLGVDANQHTGPALRNLVIPHHAERRVTPLGWRRQTFPSRTFRIALSSMLSASKRLSLPFSSSSWRRRRASETSNPPYFAFSL